MSVNNIPEDSGQPDGDSLHIKSTAAADGSKLPSLALLLPNRRPKQLFRGQSSVNLPPLSRIEQNALFCCQERRPLSNRVSSEKLVNHMHESPPRETPSHFYRTPQRPTTTITTAKEGTAGSSIRTAPRRHHSATAQSRMSIPPTASGRQPSSHATPIPVLAGPACPSSAASPLRPLPQEEEGGGVERVLLADELPRIDLLADPEDVEAGPPGRPVMATLSGATASGGQMEKASLKSSLKVEDTILRLNIGGSSYRIRTRSILKHGADTLLGRFVRMNEQHRRSWADAYFDEEDEYFFERVPRYFDPIYDFYASGKLHVPKDLCFDKFMAELRFWAVSKAKMDDCCSPFAQYCHFKKPHHLDTPEKDHFIGLRFAKVRRRLWLILEGHSNSKWWKFFEITSTSFVVLSITALILASMPEFQVLDSSSPNTPAGAGAAYPTYPKVTGFTISTTTVMRDGEEHRIEMVEHPVFNYVENICVIYFTLEYLLRFWVSPEKVQFVKEFLNVIDLLAIAPFVFELVLLFVGIRGDNIRKVRWAFLTVRLLRVLRVVRIAKLGRFSPGLTNFALTLRKSKKQMQMVAIVLLTVIIFFSTLVYFMEKDEPNTTFTSIPASFWWCLFSQTKWVPQTAAGKIVGGGAITCGMLVLALPIAILVSNFMEVARAARSRSCPSGRRNCWSPTGGGREYWSSGPYCSHTPGV